mgnify:CR=1 FL=1
MSQVQVANVTTKDKFTDLLLSSPFLNTQFPSIASKLALGSSPETWAMMVGIPFALSFFFILFLLIISNFKNLNICVSIDGTGSVFEYLRYPLKWNKLTENLKKFKAITPMVSVSAMISNLNIFFIEYLHNIIFCKESFFN